jgi:hypothetical protein
VTGTIPKESNCPPDHGVKPLVSTSTTKNITQ